MKKALGSLGQLKLGAMSHSKNRSSKGDKWIGVTDAIDHIRSIVGGDADLAKYELRSALSDDVISARFGPDIDPADPVKTLFWGSPSSADVVPPKFWNHTFLFAVGLGFVTDQDTSAELGNDDTRPTRRRTLYIDRHKLLELWPRSDRDTSLVSGHTAHSAEPKSRTPTATLEKIHEVATAIYLSAGNSPPNIEEAYILVRQRLQAERKLAPRQKVRQVLAASEFASRRLPTGARKRS